MTCWTSRQNLSYYQQAVAWAREHTPAGGKILDVGGGITMGCRYLADLEGYDRTSVELRHGDQTMQGVRLILSAFEYWKPDQHYDTVLCLQCVEHVERPQEFVRKLLEVGDRLILSVPYRWAKGREVSHRHDPIDEWTVMGWTGRVPNEIKITGSEPWVRMISLYQSHTPKPNPILEP